MNPDDPQRFEQARERFLQGLACLQAGDAAAAEPHFLAALERVPGRISTLVNLAATRLALDRPAEALDAADAVLAQLPGDPDALRHRGIALARLNRHADALEALDRLLAEGEGPTEAWLQRAMSRHALGRIDTALEAYAEVNRRAPALHLAWSQRGGLLRELGRLDEAAHCYEQALAQGAPEAAHRYYLASLGRGEAPAQPPEGFVGALFDHYADGFDQHLRDTLGYDAPERLVQQLAALGRGPFDAALDLGCGTGLVGTLLRRRCQRLVGIDLSAGMLEQARRRGDYDACIQADFCDFMARSEDRYDLVIAADSFIYLGDLAPVFAGVRRVLRPGGSFSFSVERATAPGVDFELRPSLRYAHAEASLRRLASEAGLEPLAIEPGPIRNDQGRPIDGLYVCLRPRPGAVTTVSGAPRTAASG